MKYSPCLAIDCRMLHMSGIGTYIRNIVPEVMTRLGACRFLLLGDAPLLRGWKHAQQLPCDVVHCAEKIYTVSEQFALYGLLRNADVIWSPHYNIPLLTRKPLIVTVHDTAHLTLPEVRRNVLRLAYAKALFGAVRRKARLILTVSAFTQQEFLQRVGRPAGEMAVVHNGVEKQWFSLPEDMPPHPRPYILAVGNIKKHKRLGFLCKNFAAMKETLSCDLLLVGNHQGFISGSEDIATLMALAPGRIHCTGELPFEALASHVRHAQALVFPSCYEGFGLPPLEAMAAGTPVLAADIPPVREVCDDGVLYFTVDDAPSLCAGLARVTGMSAEERHAVTLRGKEVAASYSWQAAGARTAELMAHCAGLPYVP